MQVAHDDALPRQCSPDHAKLRPNKKHEVTDDHTRQAIASSVFQVEGIQVVSKTQQQA